MNKQLAVIRCDASDTMGGGHVERCLILANKLSHEGWACAFFLNETALSVVPRIANSKHLLNVLETSNIEDEYEKIVNFRPGCELFIIDHYDRGIDYELKFKEWAKNIFVFDDHSSNKHDCDFVINAGVIDSNIYDGLVNQNTKLLLGPSFSLIRDEFIEIREDSINKRKSYSNDKYNLLISFGRADSHGVTLAAIKVVKHIINSFNKIDIVIGSQCKHLDEIISTAKYSLNNYEIHIDTTEMASLIQNADIGIGAGGGSAWERCCLGLPSIIIETSSNQINIINIIKNRNAGVFVGNYNVITFSELKCAVEELISDSKNLINMAQAGLNLCDGRGAENIYSELNYQFKA